MPTYEYACTSCGKHLEVHQRLTDDPLTVCAACGGVLRKVFHPAGIVFKGSGFYATDSRSGSKAGASSGSGASAGSGSGGDSTATPAAAGDATATSTSAPATPAPATPASKPAPASGAAS